MLFEDYGIRSRKNNPMTQMFTGWNRLDTSVSTVSICSVRWMDTCTSLTGQPLKQPFSEEATIKLDYVFSLLNYSLTPILSPGDLSAPRTPNHLTRVWIFSNTWVLQLQIISWLSQLPQSLPLCVNFTSLTSEDNYIPSSSSPWGSPASYCHSSVDC